MKCALLTVVVTLCSTGLGSSQSAQNVDAALSKAIVARDAAASALDMRTFAAFSPPNAVFVMSTGDVQNTQQRVAALGARPRGGPRPTFSDDHLQMFGETAIRTYKFEGHTLEGSPVSQRNMEVWVKQNGRWQMVGAQFTRIN